MGAGRGARSPGRPGCRVRYPHGPARGPGRAVGPAARKRPPGPAHRAAASPPGRPRRPAAPRVPPTMNALPALPHSTLAERSTSVDTTDSYRDLQAHLQALQATRNQLMALMHKSGNIRDAMAVLDRLTSVDTDIDAVQGQILASANSVMLSTITVKL